MRIKTFAASLTMIAVVALFATSLNPSTAGAQQERPPAPVTVVNTDANPVPIRASEPLLVSGQVSVEGPVTVSVEPVTGGGQSFFIEGTRTATVGQVVVASAISIDFVGGSKDLILWNDGGIVARIPGRSGGNVSLAFARPIAFDSISCFGPDTAICFIGWVGNAP